MGCERDKHCKHIGMAEGGKKFGIGSNTPFGGACSWVFRRTEHRVERPLQHAREDGGNIPKCDSNLLSIKRYDGSWSSGWYCHCYDENYIAESNSQRNEADRFDTGFAGRVGIWCLYCGQCVKRKQRPGSCHSSGLKYVKPQSRTALLSFSQHPS